jgi:hypothetical protein
LIRGSDRTRSDEPILSVLNLADLAHALPVAGGNASLVAALVSLPQKSVASSFQASPLPSVGGSDRAIVLCGHLAIQRRQSAIFADRDFASRARVTAIETWSRRYCGHFSRSLFVSLFRRERAPVGSLGHAANGLGRRRNISRGV